MKPTNAQRQLKDRLKGQKTASYVVGDKARNFDYTKTNGRDEFWSIELLCSDFSEKEDVISSHRDILSACLGELLSSPAARLLIKEAAKEDWMVSISDRNGYDYHLDVAERQIIFDDNGLSASALARSEYFRNVLTISLIRALRDVWQEKRHGGFDDRYGPEDILMLERVRAADCDVMTILVTWEMRSEGRSDLWRYMIGSEEGDIAMAFSGYLERDPSAAYTGQALQAAFNQWYRCEERIKACDHETLEYMDTLVHEKNDKNPFGNERLTPVSIEILSCLPDKTAYLRGHGREIMRDPVYAGLNDPINQTHLTQIIHDMQAILIQGVPFRDKALANKIFPDGKLTCAESCKSIQ